MNKKLLVFVLCLSVLFLFTACTNNESDQYLEQCKTAFNQLRDVDSLHYSCHTTHKNGQDVTESSVETWSSGSDFVSHSVNGDMEGWMLYKDGVMYSKMDDSWINFGSVSKVALPPWESNDWDELAYQVTDVEKSGGELVITCSKTNDADAFVCAFRFADDTLHSMAYTGEMTDLDGVTWLQTMVYTFHDTDAAEIQNQIDTVYQTVE